MLLRALARDGERFRLALDEALGEIGRQPGPIFGKRLANDAERRLAMLLFDGSTDAEKTFAVEQFRGLVPDRVLAAVYSAKRNWSLPGIDRVRRLAGVTDEHGAPLPGYVLNGNGCINDAVSNSPLDEY